MANKEIRNYTEETAPADSDIILLQKASNNGYRRVKVENIVQPGKITPNKKSGGFYATLHDFGAGTGSKSITGVGFQPKAVIILGNNRTSTTETTGTNGYAYDTGSGITQGHQAHYSSNTSSTSEVTSNTTAAFQSVTNSAVEFTGAVTSFDADGITVNVTANTGAASGNYAKFHVIFFG